jgi:TolA-binding protein
MTNRQQKIIAAEDQIQKLKTKIENLILIKESLESKVNIWKKQEANGEPDFRIKKKNLQNQKDPSSVPSRALTPEELVEQYSVKADPFLDPSTINRIDPKLEVKSF